MTKSVRQVPYLSLTIDEFNPNHRIRFVAFASPIRYLFDLSTAVGDESFYLAPKLANEVSVQLRVAGQAPIAHTASGADLHLSLHESGAVNLHSGGQRQSLRPAGAGRGAQGLAVRFVFNRLNLFQTGSHDEFNSLPKRYTPIPVVGFWEQYSVCLDVYQCDRDELWSMPTLPDVLQVHARIQPVRKQSDYHFLVWQHSKAERYPADLAILYSPSPVGNVD
jgi:hypothetical protein